MSTQLVLGVAGAVVGSFFGMPQLGFMAGAAIGSLVDQPDGPDPGDLTSPQINAGSPMVRGYGRFKVALSPIWLSDFSSQTHGGGKGSPEPSFVTYSIDCLFAAAEVTNVVAITRVWKNKKLIYSLLAESDDATKAASAATEEWQSLTLRDGNQAQVPWSVYEDAVGTANAPAQRGYCSIGLQGLNCDGDKRVPLIEVELVTASEGSYTPGLTGGVVGSQSGSSYILSMPADIMAGDALVAFIYHTSPSFAPTFGSGWGALLNASQESSGATRLHYYTRTATGDAGDDNAEFEINGGQTDAVDWVVIAIRGVTDTDWPAGFSQSSSGSDDANAGFEAAGSGEDINPGAILKPAGDQVVMTLAFLFAPTAGATVTSAPSGYTLAQNVSSTFQASPEYKGRLALAYKEENGTAFNPGDFDITAGSGYGGGGYGSLTFGITFNADATGDGITPLPVTLSSIIDAELAKNEAIDLADFDTTECDDIYVTGYKCTGTPAASIAECCDIYYVDLVPGNPLRFVPRGEAVVATLTNAEVGVGVDGPAEPFTGLREDNDDEQPAVTGLQYPNLANSLDPGYERSDRLTTESTAFTKLSTQVVLAPDEAKGRAIAHNLLRIASRYTADVSYSDKRAALQPGDAITLPDELGNSYNLLIRSDTYADGVHKAKVELYDTSALVYTGITDEDYTDSITVAAPMDTTLVPLDVPILRDEDDDAGAYDAVRGDGTATFPGALVRISNDNSDFSTIATVNPIESVIGTTTGALPDFTGGYVWDEISSVDVLVGDGQELASSTRDAMHADPSINVAFIGSHGRWEVVRFRTATLSSGGYTLSGFLRGLRGTEAYISTHADGDWFVLASTALRRMGWSLADVGVTKWLKAVTNGRSAAGVDSQAFANTAVGKRPFSPTALTVERDVATDDITFHWARRTRLQVRYGGPGGSYIPLGETTEAYRVDIYTDASKLTLAHQIEVTEEEAPFSSADQTTYLGGVAVYPAPYWNVVQIGSGFSESPPSDPGGPVPGGPALPSLPFPANTANSNWSGTWDGVSDAVASDAATITTYSRVTDPGGMAVILDRIHADFATSYGGQRAELTWTQPAYALTVNDTHWIAIAGKLKTGEFSASANTHLWFQTHSRVQGDTTPDTYIEYRPLTNQMYVGRAWSVDNPTYGGGVWSAASSEASVDYTGTMPDDGTWTRFKIKKKPGWLPSQHPSFEVWMSLDGGAYVKIVDLVSTGSTLGVDFFPNTYNPGASGYLDSYPREGIYYYLPPVPGTTLAYYLTPIFWGTGADRSAEAEASLLQLD